MAAHFTQDDFVPLDELVQQLANSCKAAASVFEDLTQDLNAIHRFLEHLIKQANNPESLLMLRCQDRRKDWLHILETLTYALCELQEHISTYYEVGAEIWLQADDAQRHLNDLRSEVMVGYDAVDTFVDSLGLSPAGRKDYSLGQIEKLLVEAMKEERLGTVRYGVTEAANGTGSLFRVERYLRNEGIDEAEIERHDARTKQLLIWVKENEPALTEIAERERLATEAERKASNGDSSDTSSTSERAMQHAPLIDFQEDNLYDSDEAGKESNEKVKDGSEKVVEVEEKVFRKDVDTDEENEELKSTMVLVARSRPSTSSRPSSVAASDVSLIEAEEESAESDWEMV